MPLRSWQDAKGDSTLAADVVIVGTGPGGAAVARVLAQAGQRVVMLEEGPSRPNFRPNLAHTQRYHMQESGAMVARGGQFIPIAAGRGVGGGSLINSAICFRTPDPVLESWVQLLGGDDRYSAQRLAPIFDEIEALIGVGVTRDEVAGENNRILVRGAAALGLPGGLIRRNAPGCVGCGICNYGCPSGGKASVDRNLIPLAIAAGAVVQGDVKVDRIDVVDGRATGVSGRVHHTDTREDVGRITVQADRVVIAAGGIGTPRLLHHAGLAAALGPVGRGLHLHPGNAILGECDHDVLMWRGATQGAFFEHPDLPGVLPHTFNAPPDTLLLLLGNVGLAAKEDMKRLPRFCGCVVMVSDEGEGRVGATSDGRADITYHFDPRDIDRIKAGMVETARVLLAGGARRVTAPVHRVGWHTDPESLGGALASKAITDFALYASHPMASCRMGADPATSVIGPTGETHGIAGLYLADSSVFPTSLGVNPQLTTMVIGTAIARGMLAAPG
jgi:choline dehydrogenase-like flavoprotein